MLSAVGRRRRNPCCAAVSCSTDGMSSAWGRRLGEGAIMACDGAPGQGLLLEEAPWGVPWPGYDGEYEEMVGVHSDGGMERG